VAGRLAGETHADVVVLHQRSEEVMDHGPTVPSDESDSQAYALVHSAVAALIAAGAGSATAQVVRGLHGEEARAIIDVARDVEADIIVVGPRGLGRLQGLLLGSVTSKLVQLADRPVLVVR
jgi:nucleotide-binding universal stress UspA family protein